MVLVATFNPENIKFGLGDPVLSEDKIYNIYNV
jgi:hypothetical protein